MGMHLSKVHGHVPTCIRYKSVCKERYRRTNKSFKNHSMHALSLSSLFLHLDSHIIMARFQESSSGSAIPCAFSRGTPNTAARSQFPPASKAAAAAATAVASRGAPPLVSACRGRGGPPTWPVVRLPSCRRAAAVVSRWWAASSTCAGHRRASQAYCLVCTAYDDGCQWSLEWTGGARCSRGLGLARAPWGISAWRG